VGDYKYKAFISYSHKDRKWAWWLHKRLETYPIPKNIVGNVTSMGPIPKRLKPIFRDREELSVSNNLGEKIETALASSQNLIILCSPAAAQSKWVNQEILTFKRNNRDAQLFSIIVEGEPYASRMPGHEVEECFPPALRYEINPDGSLSDTPAEPLAADLRPHADGKRLGFLKLISGMIDVGLDEVVQRDMRRGRKRVIAIMSGSLATVLTMAILTGFALDARSEAEQRRNDAESLIDFMVGDLRDRLRPVGRLDVLDGVANEAISYYEGQELSTLGCSERGRWGRAINLASEVAVKKGSFEEFELYTNNSFALTKKNVQLCKSSNSSIFDYSQSAFWSGYSALLEKDNINAGKRFQLSKELMQQLLNLNPDNVLYQKEFAAALVNLGAYRINELDHANALNNFIKAEEIYSVLTSKEPNDPEIARNYADTIGWKAKTYSQMDDLKLSKKNRLSEVREATRILSEINSNDWTAHYIKYSAIRALARIEYLQKNYRDSIQYGYECEIGFEKLVQQDVSNNKWKKGLALCQVLLMEANFQIDLIKNGQLINDRFGKTLEALPKNMKISRQSLKAELGI